MALSEICVRKNRVGDQNGARFVVQRRSPVAPPSDQTPEQAQEQLVVPGPKISSSLITDYQADLPPSQAESLPQALALTSSSSALSSPSSQHQLQQAPIRNVNPGDRVNIPCSLANMGGSIQFAKDDQPIILDSGCAHCQLDISNDGQASLTINRVSFKDQGHWQCWRLDSQGKVKQKIPIIQLVITNSPELPILIVNDKELLGGNNLDATITIKENEIVSFKCLIKGASTPLDYVYWMLDSTQNVTHLSQLMMEYSQEDNHYSTQSILKLNATKSMNLKSISCLSNHQLWLTPMTVTASMNVLYEPSFTISREPGFGVPVSEGMLVILKCEIDSNPASNPIWIKDADNKTSSSNEANNKLLTSTSSSGASSAAAGEPIVLDTREDGSVMFQPVTQQDSGWYRCKTENKYGNFSSFGYYLNVRPASSSSSSATSISNSASLPLAAPTNSLLAQQQQQQQQQLVTQSQSPLRSGSSFQTTNNNQAGHQSYQKVMSPNQMIAPAPLRAQTMGGLLAKAPSAQASSSLSSSGGIINDQPIFPMLPRPPPASIAGAGSNVFAQDPSRCPPTTGNNRNVDGFPQIDHPISTVNAVLGRQLILPLRFCCNPGPARVFWIHRHLAMIPGRMFGPYITRDIYTTYNSFYCYESTFEIESVKPEDIGTVYVFVSNEKGHAGAQINIQLANPNNIQMDSNQLNQNSIGSRFSLSHSGSQQLENKTLMSFVILISSLISFIIRSNSHYSIGPANNWTRRIS